MKFIDLVRSKGERLVFPINCLPAWQLINKDIGSICHDPLVKYEASMAFAEKFQPDIVFFLAILPFRQKHWEQESIFHPTGCLRLPVIL